MLAREVSGAGQGGGAAGRTPRGRRAPRPVTPAGNARRAVDRLPTRAALRVAAETTPGRPGGQGTDTELAREVGHDQCEEADAAKEERGLLGRAADAAWAPRGQEGPADAKVEGAARTQTASGLRTPVRGSGSEPAHRPAWSGEVARTTVEGRCAWPR